LKEETLYSTLWRAGFVRGFGPVVRHTAALINMDRITNNIHFAIEH
jgi:hypothetical protein